MPFLTVTHDNETISIDCLDRHDLINGGELFILGTNNTEEIHRFILKHGYNGTRYSGGKGEYTDCDVSLREDDNGTLVWGTVELSNKQDKGLVTKQVDVGALKDIQGGLQASLSPKVTFSSDMDEMKIEADNARMAYIGRAIYSLTKILNK